MAKTQPQKQEITIFTDRGVGDSRFFDKIDKFTYGLLYSAFFGNMIYDLLMAKKSDSSFDANNFPIAIGIVMFTIIDFMHLYADVENSIGRKLKYKSWDYILCDILASVLLFWSFVAVKNYQTTEGMWLFCVVPICIMCYKLTYNWIRLERNLFILFACLGLMAGTIGQIIFNTKSLKDFDEFVKWMTYTIVLIYGVYVFYFYNYFSQKTSREKIPLA